MYVSCSSHNPGVCVYVCWSTHPMSNNRILLDSKAIPVVNLFGALAALPMTTDHFVPSSLMP